MMMLSCTQCVCDDGDGDLNGVGVGSAADILSTAVGAVYVVSAVLVVIAAPYDDTAQTAVDGDSAAHATPTITNGPGAYDAPIWFAGYAVDLDWKDVAYPASASDADGPFVGVVRWLVMRLDH